MTRQRRGIITAMARLYVEIISSEFLASLSCVVRRRGISSRVPYSTLPFRNSFLALNLNPFFPFNSASTYLPCSNRHRPSFGERGEGCCETTIPELRDDELPVPALLSRDTRRQLKVKGFKGTVILMDGSDMTLHTEEMCN